MGMIRNIINNFTKQEIDIDELVDFIAEETRIKRDTIELVLDAEDIYLREKGIIIDQSGMLSLFSF